MGFEKLTAAMKQTKIQQESGIKVEATTLEEALKQGSELLKTSIINLDYEVVQRGKSGFLGLGKKNFIIKVWKTGELDLSQMKKSGTNNDFQEEDLELNLPKDGEAKLKIKKAGIYLKVSKPKNGGKAIDMKEVENVLFRRGVHHFNKNKITKILKDSSGEWNKIGEWIPNPEYDSKLSVSIAQDQMEASITMSAPIYSGRTLEPEEIFNTLESEGVKFGILYEKIKEVADEEIVNIPVVVAKGQPPKHGKDAQILYKFRTGLEDMTQVTIDENGDKADYRQLNKVQNVIAGQIVAEKVLAQRGTPGRTVTNRLLESRDGKDILLRIGKNVRLSEDRLKAYSECDGQVFLSGGDITVREIYEVRGDVDYNIGNIDFVGSVIVHGNVKENFRIKAAGEVRINGVASKAEIIAEGKIYCKGGIKGGKIKSNQSIYSRYIDNADISAQGDVIAKEEIINSKIIASGRVICLTGKGGIIGGRIIAGLQITAKRLGSDSYTPTTLEAGVDPSVRLKLEQIEEQKKQLERKFEILINSMDAIEDEKKEGKLSKKKEKVLQKMQLAREEYAKKLAILGDKIAKISQYLVGMENKGAVSARFMVFPGVKIIIKKAEYDVRNEYKSVTFKYSAGLIKPEKYEPLDTSADKAKKQEEREKEKHKEKEKENDKQKEKNKEKAAQKNEKPK